MFDFFRSRDKAVRTTLTVLLGLVALSMVAYLVPGGPGGGMGMQETVLAEVCDDTVTLRQVQLQLQAYLRNKNVPPAALQNYIPDFVNQYVSERASACFADELGFRVSNEEVANAIKSMLPQIFGGGFNKELYARFLAEQNLTIAEFEHNVRKQMQRTKLVNLAAEGIVVTADEIEQEFRRRNEKIKIDYVQFNADNFKKQVNLSPADLEAFFKQNQASYRIPEKRSFEMLVASEEKMGAQVTVTDEALRQMYSNAGDRFRSGERVNVRHILLTTMDKSADDVKKLEAKANDLLKQVKGGADFAKLAKENSDDPGSKDKGGDLGWTTKGQMVPEFEKAAFETKKGEFAPVIKTTYGYHVIQVMDREEAKVKPFEEAKAELATEYRRLQVQSRMEQSTEQARAELAKNPKNGAAIAAKYGLSHYAVQDVTPGAPLQEIGVVGDFDSAIFSTQVGGVTNSIVTPGNKLVFGTVTGITPARPAQLAEVEAQVRAAATEQKAMQLAMQKQQEVAEMMKSNPDLKAVAKAVGGEVKTSAEFTRDGAAEGVGSGTYFAELFGKQPGAMTGPVNVSGTVVVARLNSKVDADLSKLPAEREALVSSLKGRRAQERVDLFDDGIVAKMISRGKVKLNQEAIRKLVDSYRS